MTSRNARARFAAEGALAGLTATVGAFAAGASVQDAGLTSGAIWMVAFALCGLFGVAVVITGVRGSSAKRVVLGLVPTTLAPTVFAYPLNLLAVLAAVGEALMLPRARIQVHP